MDAPHTRTRRPARTVLLVAGALAALGSAACAPEPATRAGADTATTAPESTSVDRPDQDSGPSTSPSTSVEPPAAPSPTEPAPPSPTPPPPAPTGDTATVARAVDGDTLELTDGTRVRLIGIDTPERGDCGYNEATAELARHVQGRTVTLHTGARDNTDRYGRLLRYIDVDGTDVNLAMIRSGWAIARYDSRDGYGPHPRESAYVTADAETPNRCAGPPVPDPAPTSSSTPPAGGSGGSDPRFGTCKEAKANGYGPYQRGQVEYGWYRDGDNDGTVCE